MNINYPKHKKYFQNWKTFETKAQSTLKSSLSNHSMEPSVMMSTSSLSSHRRIQQIPPKKKLEIKNPIQKNRKINLQSQIQSSSRITISSQTESIEYKEIKPLISWKKYTHLFCGMQRGKGTDGCSCDQPCPWMKLWTTSYKQQNYKLFKNLPWSSVAQKNLIQIGKDITRTHGQCPTFQSQNYRQMLKQVLIAYSIYDRQVGYVQGVNMVAGVLLYHIKNSEMSFWALVDIMQDQQLRMIYLQGFQNLKQHCRNIMNILVTKVNDLFNYMKEMCIEGEFFLYGWLLSLMSTCVPLQYMHFIIDSFRKKGWKFMYQLVITYLLYIKEGLMLAEDPSQFLSVLNTNSSRQLGIEWHEVIESSHKLNIDSEFFQ